MTRSDHPLLAAGSRPLIGVVHLPPLSGPEAPDTNALLTRARSDAKAYQEAGFDALLIENLGDVPYPKDASGPYVAAIMARISEHVREATRVPVGVNVLRNDAQGALAAAAAAQCDFIRCNVLTGAVVADQGIIEGCAHELEAYRRRIGPAASGVFIAADVDVKHAQAMSPRSLEDEAADAVGRGGADVILVTGPATASAADLEHVRRIRSRLHAPVWVASGVTVETIAETLEVAQGVIVGSAAKRDGEAGNPVDPERARSLAKAAGKDPARG